MNGTLNVEDGRFVLRFECWLAHPPEKVWAALTDPAELTHSFPRTCRPICDGAAPCGSRAATIGPPA